MASYITQYANSSRNSRVLQAPRKLSTFKPVTELQKTANGVPIPAPRFLLASPAGDHVIVDRGTRKEILDGGGHLARLEGFVPSMLIVARSEGFIAGPWYLPWEADLSFARPPEAIRSPPAAKDWALSFEGEIFLQLLQGPRNRFIPVPFIDLLADQYNPANRAFNLLWRERVEGGPGCGAIGPNQRAALAMKDGRFFVFRNEFLDTHPTEKPGQYIRTKAKLTFSPYEMSVIEPGYGVLSMHPNVESTPSGFDSVVHRLDTVGHELWSVHVPFLVRQPPIDGSGGRIYVAGDGLAAVEDGNTVWLQAPGRRVFATAFEDGSLAVAIDFTLQILDRDGKVRQSFQTASSEAITTPPAIAGDGSIWVGTEKAIYVAR